MYLVNDSISVTTTTNITDTSNGTSVHTGIVRGVKYSGNISSSASLSITTSGGKSILTSLTVSTGFFKVPVNVVVNTTNGAVANSYSPVSLVNETITVSVTNSSAGGQTGTFLFDIQGGA